MGYQLPLQWRFTLGMAAVPVAIWNLNKIAYDVEERKAAGETVSYSDIYRHPNMKFAAYGIGSSLWYSTNALFGSDMALARAFTDRVTVPKFAVYLAAGAAGAILGAAIGIGISQAIWGQSGRDTAIEVYTGKVSLSEWWGAVSKIPSLR